MNILIVDDEYDIRTLMQWMLEGWGYDVQTASNGQAALETARQRVPDVVLMDLNMPVMNGFDAARRLRLLPQMTNARIFAVSGYLDNNQEWCDRALAAGCDKCLGKPVDLEVLRLELLQADAARRMLGITRRTDQQARAMRRGGGGPGAPGAAAAMKERAST